MMKSITMRFRALGLAITAGQIIYGRVLDEAERKSRLPEGGHGFGSLASGAHGRHQHHSRPGRSGVAKARRAARKRQRKL